MQLKFSCHTVYKKCTIPEQYPVGTIHHTQYTFQIKKILINRGAYSVKIVCRLSRVNNINEDVEFQVTLEWINNFG
jgi:hypothetical protein